MVSIVPEHACLLILLKTALFNSRLEISDDANWDKIFESAKAQCIVPLLTPYVPMDQRNKWLEFSYQNKARFMKMLHEQNTVANLFKSNSIPFAILKGTAAAVYYPSPTSRTYGDIDIYLSKEHFESAKNLLQANGYEYIHDEDRHYEYMKNGIEFELHSKYCSNHYNDIEHILLNGLSNAVECCVCNSSFPLLPTYENGLVLLGHIMMHLKTSGIGLRQIIDWMMFVHKELDDSTWEKHFRALAVEAGLEKLAITVTFMCKKWLGLPDEITWCNDADEEVVDQLLIRVLDDGNFGQDRAPVESIKKSMKRVGIFRHLQQNGLDNWPLAQKYQIFRSFAWFYQFFRYLFSGIIGLLSGRKVFMKEKHIMSLDELWERLE